MRGVRLGVVDMNGRSASVVGLQLAATEVGSKRRRHGRPARVVDIARRGSLPVGFFGRFTKDYVRNNRAPSRRSGQHGRAGARHDTPRGVPPFGEGRRSARLVAVLHGRRLVRDDRDARIPAEARMDQERAKPVFPRHGPQERTARGRRQLPAVAYCRAGSSSARTRGGDARSCRRWSCLRRPVTRS
jgi:hypothetical protein